MSPAGDRTLGELDDAHQEENTAARRRVERAEEYISYYRSRMSMMQESFYEAAVRQGVVDDPGFRAELDRVTDEIEHNVRGAAVVVARLDEDYQAGLVRQSAELEDLTRRRSSSTHG